MEGPQAFKRLLEDDEDSAGATTDIIKKSCLRTQFFTTLSEGLSHTQKDLIGDSGFRFVLYIPKYRSEIKIAAMLMLCYDPDSSEMRLDDGRVAKITKNDISIILGLAQGKPLDRDLSSAQVQEAIEQASKIFPPKIRKQNTSATGSVSVATAIEKLNQMRGKDLETDEEKKIFMAALMICTVVHFLAPSKRTKELDAGVVQAVTTKDGSKDYDWAGFTLESLKEASREFKEDLLRKDSTNEITVPGCTMLLVLFYLLKFTDCSIPYELSIDLGPSGSEKKKPLISRFTSDKIRRMLKMDEDKRLLMPTYILLSTKTKVNTIALRMYDVARKRGTNIQDYHQLSKFNEKTTTASDDAMTKVIGDIVREEFMKFIVTIKTELTKFHRKSLSEFKQDEPLASLLGRIASTKLDNCYNSWKSTGGSLQPHISSGPQKRKHIVIMVDTDTEDEKDAAEGLLNLGETASMVATSSEGLEDIPREIEEALGGSSTKEVNLQSSNEEVKEKGKKGSATLQYTLSIQGPKVRRKMRTPLQTNKRPPGQWNLPQWDLTPGRIQRDSQAKLVKETRDPTDTEVAASGPVFDKTPSNSPSSETF